MGMYYFKHTYVKLAKNERKEKLSVRTTARPENEKMIYCLHTHESAFFQLLRLSKRLKGKGKRDTKKSKNLLKEIKAWVFFNFPQKVGGWSIF